MFEASFVEDKGRSRFTGATLTSFVLQGMLVALLIVIPYLLTQALPVTELATTLVTAPPPPPPPPAAAAPKVMPVKSVEQINPLQEPLKIPQKVVITPEPEPPVQAPAVAGVIGGVAGGTPDGQVGGVIGGILSSVPAEVPKVATPERVRVSQGVVQGLLVKKVLPDYPAIAKSARIQGAVVLQAVIAKDGSVRDLKVVQGHPLLSAAAINAVKQWQFRPYMLNGQPTEVESTITVNFRLGDDQAS